MGVNLAAIRKIVDNQLEIRISYNPYKYFVQHDEELQRAWLVQRR